MAENLEKQVCPACGADIRPNALFCFNCGSQVASDEEVQAENEREPKVSDAWFKEEIAPVPKVEEAVVSAKATAAVKEKTVTERTDRKEKIQPENSIKLKSAASMRDKSKPSARKSVNIVWEEPKSAPNVWFLVASLILAGFAIFILFAMLYIR